MSPLTLLNEPPTRGRVEAEKGFTLNEFLMKVKKCFLASAQGEIRSDTKPLQGIQLAEGLKTVPRNFVGKMLSISSADATKSTQSRTRSLLILSDATSSINIKFEPLADMKLKPAKCSRRRARNTRQIGFSKDSRGTRLVGAR